MAVAFEPTRYISVEGGFFLNDTDNVLAFDPDEDKIGGEIPAPFTGLPPLSAGGDGWQGGVEFGSRVDPVWDYRVGVNLIDLGAEGAADGSATASTELRIGYADAEIGYRPEFGDNLGLRLFGGVRGLVASADSTFAFGSEEEKLGEFKDDTWAIGPRVGVGIAIPVIEERGISLVGSVAGAALFGKRDTDYSYDIRQNQEFVPIDQSFSDSVTIWNADIMAGLAIPLTSSAGITLGYKGQGFGDLVRSRSDIVSSGEYTDDGERDVWVHGPFVKMTISLD